MPESARCSKSQSSSLADSCRVAVSSQSETGGGVADHDRSGVTEQPSRRQGEPTPVSERLESSIVQDCFA